MHKLVFKETPSGHWPTSRARSTAPFVECGGRVRSFHPGVADGETVAKIVRDNVARETRLHTDESRRYVKAGAEFAAHETVNHSAKEYARGDVTTNTVEGYFQFSSAGCAVPTSIAPKSICTAISRNLISDLITAPLSALPMGNVPRLQ
jgi:hypothetical protein